MPKKRRVVRRRPTSNPRKAVGAAVKASAPKRAKRKAAKKTTPRKAPKRKRVVKAATTTRRTTTMAKKKRSTKRPSVKRKSPKRVAAGKKAARTRKRRQSMKSSSPRRRKATKRRATKRLRTRATITVKANPRRRRRRRVQSNPGGRGITFRARRRPGERKYSVYKVRRTVRKSKKGTLYHKYSVRRISKNPVAGLKTALMDGGGVFLGVLGVRALNHYLGGFLASKITSLPVSVSKMIPSTVSLLLAALAPKVIKGKPGLCNKLQMAAGIGFLDAIMTNFVAPSLPTSMQFLTGGSTTVIASTPSSAGEYLPMGVDVQEAMADYVSDPSRMLTSGGAFGGYGVDVSEALAADEVVGLKRGYAAGTLAHTVFND